MSTQNNIYPKPCVIDAILRFIGILQQTNIGKYSPRKNIFVQIDLSNKQIHKQLILQQQLQPTYYNKKPCHTRAKPKMSNSFELLQGSIAEIQKKYEILSDIVY